jgi:hypothetical protein
MLVVSGVVGGLLAGGCVTTPKLPWQAPAPSNVVKCADLNTTTPVLPPVTSVEKFAPVSNLRPGFLLVKYYAARSGDDVYAVGIHITDDGVTVPFAVGPMKGVPSSWSDSVESPAPNTSPETVKQWSLFFSKLREFQYVRPGGFLCRNNADCGKSPDAPPPEVTGSASAGGGGGFGGLLPGEPSERYAQRATAPRLFLSDATNPGPDAARVVAQTAANACKAVELLAR